MQPAPDVLHASQGKVHQEQQSRPVGTSPQILGPSSAEPPFTTTASTLGKDQLTERNGQRESDSEVVKDSLEDPQQSNEGLHDRQAASDYESHSVDGSPPSPERNDCDVELLPGLQNMNQIPSLEELCSLQRAVNLLVPKYYTNVKGISGTIRPSPLADLLVRGKDAICEVHGTREVVLIDLGCGPGHAVWCAALSGLFKCIIGVDFPENERNIENARTEFLAKANTHPLLGRYVKQFQKVQFDWLACNKANAEPLADVLLVDKAKSSMVYWFCTGWGAPDIIETAQIISQVPSVDGVVCLPRDMGIGACELLEALNSTPENKMFFMHSKESNVCMSGHGSHTAYIFVRDAKFEYEKCFRPVPLRGQEVEVLFENPLKWYSGHVKNVYVVDRRVEILLEDGDTEHYPFDDSDVFYLPTMHNQWRQVGNVEGPSMLKAQCSFCTLCTEALRKPDSWCCPRCCKTAYHLKCIGLPAPLESICPFCRAELAGIGRSQVPQLRKGSNEEVIDCFSCGNSIEIVDDKLMFAHCIYCNQRYGNCCTSQSMDMSMPYKCPSCIGILSHDEVLKLSLEPIAESINSIIKQNSIGGSAKVSRKKEAINAIRRMDDFARIHNSLQDNCGWQLIEKYLGVIIEMTWFQIRNDLDPSMGPFHLINLLGMEDGPDLALVDETCKKFVKHCLQKALAQEKGRAAAKQDESKVRIASRHAYRSTGMRLGLASADFRDSSWWQLFKVALVELAQRNDVFIFSRPPVDLCGDPHFEELRLHCTILDFEESTSDPTIAHHIRKAGLDVLMDGGGPTFGSFTGVMALLPDILRGAFLGYAGTQPGGHIDFTIGDRHVLPLDGPQARRAEEALMLMHCYQPNDYFPSSVPIRSVEPSPETTRSDWNLPEGKFVFAYFCRNGRISSCLMETFVNIANGVPDSVFWFRKSSAFAVFRIQFFFRRAGIALERIIFAPDVPSPVHRERIKHADMILDSRFFGGHTTCSDGLLAGTPYLAMKGEFFQSRVSYSLNKNMLGDLGDELICSSLEEYERKAIYLATEGLRRLGEIREVLKSKVRSRLGICDGHRWTADLERGLSVYVNIMKSSCGHENGHKKLPDLLYESESNEVTISYHRVLPQREADSVIRAGSANPHPICEPCATSSSLSKRSREREGAKTCYEEDVRAEKRSRLHVAELQAVSSSQVSSESAMVETSNVPVSLPSSRNQTLWLSHIKRLTDQGDTETARVESYRLIQHDLPEGREIHRVKTAGGSWIPAIQLPLKMVKKNRETGNEAGFVQVCLLYVAKGPHGLHLYSAEEFSLGNFLTNYDGKFVNDSSKVTNPIRVISLSYSLQWAVDGGGVDEVELVLKGSLGCMSNHSVDESSVAKYAYKGWYSPVSGHFESCWLVARKDGKKHVEITTYYTPGAADRHGIPPRGLVPGGNEIADEDMAAVPAVVRECMRKVQICCGYHLVRVQGSGAFGTAVMVRSGEEKFTIKFGTSRYDSGGARSVLVEASTMDIAERSKNGIFSLRLQRTGWPSGAALVTALGLRVAAVSMECADMDAHCIVDKLGERFREAAVDEKLLPDTKGLSKAVLITVMWMHGENLAHCDITPRNIFLKRLSQRPEDKRVAYFTLGDEFLQVILADWGHSRWDGEFGGRRAVHRFSPSGKEHGHIPNLEGICNSERFSEGVVPVGKQQLQVLFGTRTGKASDFRIPGRGTILIRPPNQEDVEKFSSGEDQRKFDKAADVWAVGVLGARICAAPLVLSAPALALLKRSNEYEIWPEHLRSCSRRASAAMASRRQGSKRAGNAMEKVGQASPDCCGLWLAEMVSQHYSGDTWPHLRRHMQGDEADEWLDFLNLLQGLLAYPISDRLSAADAVEHSCLSNIGMSESDD